MATNLDKLKTYLKIEDNSEDALLSLLLEQADSKILNKRFPFGYTEDQKAKALIQYADIELDIAIYLYNRRGSEGQTSHGEVGMSRGYESAGVPNSFVADIVPLVKVF